MKRAAFVEIAGWGYQVVVWFRSEYDFRTISCPEIYFLLLLRTHTFTCFLRNVHLIFSNRDNFLQKTSEGKINALSGDNES